MIDFIDDREGWVLNLDGTGLLKTDDGAATWTIVELPFSEHLVAMDFASPLVGWVMNSRLEVFKTDNSGGSWERQLQLRTGTIVVEGQEFDLARIPGSVDRGAIIVAFSDTHVWLVYELTCCDSPPIPVAFESLDAGVSWEGKILPTDPRFQGRYYPTAMFDGRGDGVWIALHETQRHDDQLKPVGSASHLYHIDNEGTNWVRQATIEGIVPITEIIFQSDKLGWFGTGSALFQTDDGGLTWEQHTQQIRAQAIYFDDANRGWIFTTNDEIYRTIDGGISWFRQSTRIGGRPIHFGSDIWTIWRSLGTTLSADRGETWEPIMDAYPTIGPRIQCISELECWDISGFKLRHSLDGGSSWKEIEPGLTSEGYFDLHFWDSDTGWVVGNNGVILNTVDSGASWSLQISESPVAISSIDCYSVMVCAALGGARDGAPGTKYSIQRVLLLTKNGGTTWHLVPLSVPFDELSIDESGRLWMRLVTGKNQSGGAFWVDLSNSTIGNELIIAESS